MKTVITLEQAQRRTRRVLLIGGAAATAWVLLPLYFLLINAFSSPETIGQFPKAFWPEGNTKSLAFLLGFQGVLSALWNSIAVAAMTMVVSIGLGAPAGYAIARFEFGGKTAFRMLIMLTRAFPLPLLALPLAVLFIRAGIDDTLWGLAMVHT
ncbi:MAG: hypothetical protein RIQ97_90, partial [Pseudomonadota bacterium]